jgi:hypothetical protein
MLVAAPSLPYLVSLALAVMFPPPVPPVPPSSQSTALLARWAWTDELAELEPFARNRMPGPGEIEIETAPSGGIKWMSGSIGPGPQLPNVFWRGTLAYGERFDRSSPAESFAALTERKAQTESWSALGLQSNDIRLSLSRESNLLWAKLNSKVMVIDPNAVPNVPLRRSGWQTEESLRLPFFGSLFVVGQVGANSGSIEYQQYKLVGKTGLGWKLPSWLGGEIQLRSGRSLANYDSDSETMMPEQLKKFVELNTRWPLADWLNVEYTGQTSSTQSATAHDMLTHEIRFAVPLSNAGQFHIGARYKMEDTPSQTLWYERTKLLIGLEFKH